MSKRLKLLLSEEIISTLKKKGAEKWLVENIPRYNPSLKLKPIYYSEKKRFYPSVTTSTYQELQKIPGRSNTIKIQTLYYNVREGKYHEEMRKDILSQLFPQHPYLKRNDGE